MRVIPEGLHTEVPRPSRQDGTSTAGLPGNVLSFHIVPLDPAYPTIGGTGHVPVNGIIKLYVRFIGMANATATTKISKKYYPRNKK